MNYPEVIKNASRTQFSIARHYGGINYNGTAYHYDAEKDELIRDDVWKSRLADNKEEAERIKRNERKKWESMRENQRDFGGF